MADLKCLYGSVWLRRLRLMMFLVAMGYPLVGAVVVAAMAGPGTGRSI